MSTAPIKGTLTNMTLKEKLYNFIKKNKKWHKKGDLFSIAYEMGYSPETAGRELRFLSEDGLIKKAYYKGLRGQKLTQYASLSIKTKPF